MPKKLSHESHYDDANKHIDVRLTVIEFEEDNLFFIYSPDLDLTGYGKTQRDARDSYNMAMEEFIRYTSNKKTTFSVLKKLGWTVTKSKKITAPTLSDLIQSRSYLEEIFTEKDFRKTHENVAIPA